MTDRRPRLSQLEQSDDFIRRHIGPAPEQVAAMLRSLGLTSLDELVERAVPTAIVADQPFTLPAPRSERQALHDLRTMAERNRVFVSMLGMGYYGTVLPTVIRRNVLENPGWYTAYTPYQAEVAQGRLEALLTYQQMVMDLTGMDLANASMLDEATAAAEAMTMARRLSKHPSMRYFVDRDCHPQTLAVLHTRAQPLGIEVMVGDAWSELPRHEVFGVLLQYPGSSGMVRDIKPVTEAAHGSGALVTVASDLLALVLLTPPGEVGADMVVGSAQRFGVPMGYGGPHAGFFATRDEYKRTMPGRIVGVSVDSHGQPALRLALQTREQHIRREKATSNICTAQVLLAVIAGLYAAWHGPEGLRRIAQRVHRLTEILAAGLRQLGCEVETPTFFDTVTVQVPNQAHRIAARAREARINLRVVDADRLGIAFDETTKREDVANLWRVFAIRAQLPDLDAFDAELAECLPAPLRRSTDFLSHPVFRGYHSETTMMRYLRRLQAKDIALDRSMIALGSCTMKLNAATELLPITWREFAQMHPFAPLDQAQGYQQLIDELEGFLCELTGFVAFSFQPNAGSQGEYTGLLCIRRWHHSRGQSQRDVCLIPASAHGTNPASAMMAGLQVVVVACDSQGNVDVADLQAKATRYTERLAALMITYPSTHGVYEEPLREICAIVHTHGGQVYLDGANLNALVCVARPALLGADVMHTNLHKTFAIPHGGGGPGMGPIGVRGHLAPFLPDHPVVAGVNPAAHPQGTIGTIAAAPWGSPGILPIAWAYIAMLGTAGLKRATQVAILNANYVARRLSPYYSILYTGKNGLVAHECIIDLRGIKDSSGITVEDVAKRLVDYGYHAPTVSFPVPDTMMIEPTESEDQREIDRFCDAMITIRAEIAAIEQGTADRDDNPLKRAPHTHRLLLTEWTRPYTREQAFFPLAAQQADKFWPPVGRVDNLLGDRHLVCTCPPMAEYAERSDS